MRTAVVGAAILGAALCLGLTPGSSNSSASEPGLETGARTNNADSESRREWFPKWGKAWAIKDCPAVQQHLAEGLNFADPLAHELSGIMIITGTCGDGTVGRAAEHFLTAAKQGRERSMLLLAKLYALGDGVPVNEAEARRWAQKAILGWGDGDHKDRRERLKSAMQQDIPASIQDEFDRIEALLDAPIESRISTASQIESGQPPFFADPQRACLWRLSTAKSDAVGAQFALAVQLLEGRGVAVNEVAGIGWLHRAASAGNPQAQSRLGTVLTKGEFGVRKDFHAAYRWLTRAKAAGIDVDTALAEAASHLKPDAVAFLAESAFEVTPPAPKTKSYRRAKECE